jgi:hypothetical protein
MPKRKIAEICGHLYRWAPVEALEPKELKV